METPHILNPGFHRVARCVLGCLLLAAWAGGAAGQKPGRPATAPPRAATDPNLLRARWHVLGAHPLAMFYYASDWVGLASLKAHAGSITLLGTQGFYLGADGSVRGQIAAEVLEVARRSNLPLMPLVANPSFDRAIAHALLHDPRAQERAATNLAYVAHRDHYLGWQLDIENIDPDDKAEYVKFVERVAARLHRDQHLLSVAVVPRFSDTYPDPPSLGFHTGEWGAPYDYRRLGRVADFVTLMAYDQHSSITPPGPVAGYDWVKAAVEYAIERMPGSKLVLGLPFYGREWTAKPGEVKSHSMMFKDWLKFRENQDGPPLWDEAARTSWFDVKDGDAQHTVWFDDSRSLREKLSLIERYHLRGFAAWRLGVEDPGFWPVAAQFEATQSAAAINHSATRKPKAPRR